MKERIFSTFILWGGIIALLYFMGTQGAAWLLAAIAGLTLYELYTLWSKSGLRPMRLTGSLTGVCCMLAGHYLPSAPGFDGALAAFGLGMALIAALSLRNPSQERLTYTILPTLAGVVIVPFAFYFLLSLVEHHARLGMHRTGMFLGIWVIAVAKFADVGGLLVGRKIGKTPLAKSISPGKTWEGVAGGLLCSVAVGALLVTLFPNAYPKDFTVWLAAMIALPVAAAGILSDLLESVFKRLAGEKDSGKLIPGIGGVYDLTDSLLLSAPVAYVLIKLTVL